MRNAVLAAIIAATLGNPSFANDVPAARKAAVQRAIDLATQNPGAFQLARPNSGLRTAINAADPGVGDTFTARDVIIDEDGTEHVRLNRFYAGLPVIGGDVVSHARAGQLLSADLGLSTTKRPALTPKLSQDEAKVFAAAAFPGVITDEPETTLVLYARGVAPKLAWQVRVLGKRNDGVPVGDIVYFIDASTGKVLGLDDQVMSIAAVGTGKSLTLGAVAIPTDSVAGGFQLVDPSRGGGSIYDAHNRANPQDVSAATLFVDSDNTWGNYQTSDRATVAADIAFGIAATWDYYKNTHGRTGIFNDGKGVRSYAHVGQDYSNAFWYGATKTMYYGDGNPADGFRPLVALDVAGHEMSHGVSAATAGLAYYTVKDTGGINEANSDIFGTLVEFSANVKGKPGNYLIGEDIYADNPSRTKALRLMFKQDADGRSFSCYIPGGFTADKTYKGGPYDPHFTGGVGNRFFYLLAEGPVVPAGFNYAPKDLVCNGNTQFAGIGRDKAGAIWFRALTVYFTSTVTYPEARAATLKAAGDLYGTNSPEAKAVATAWSAVLVN
ncbi:M4 family metallopeptidase [Luteibacter sp. CQ10]|uniref:M4 family metallopeptidase n=1 Tax=Luteibacter sp. CQ10 TaxID=2805821 RepID=UPI0034A47EC2